MRFSFITINELLSTFVFKLIGHQKKMFTNKVYILDLFLRKERVDGQQNML